MELFGYEIKKKEPVKSGYDEYQKKREAQREALTEVYKDIESFVASKYVPFTMMEMTDEMALMAKMIVSHIRIYKMA